MRPAASGDVLPSVLIQICNDLAAPVPRAEDWQAEIAHFSRRIAFGDMRRELPAHLEEKYWRAYIATYLPRYMPRLNHGLACAGLELEGLVCRADKVRVCDLGSGVGTFCVAALGALDRACLTMNRQLQVHLTACDRSEPALKMLQELLRRCRDAGLWPQLDVQVSVEFGDMFEVNVQMCDICVFGHSLCEQFQDKGRLLLQKLPAMLAATMDRVMAKRGVVVAIEPILKTNPDAIIELRDALSESDSISILGPCPTSHGRCPESTSPRLCGATAPPVRWMLDSPAANDLFGCAERAGLARRIGRWAQFEGYTSLRFGALVLARRSAASRPGSTGTWVMRDTDESGCGYICVDDHGRPTVLRLPRPGRTPRRTFFEVVRLVEVPAVSQKDLPAGYRSSALYGDGWI